MSSSSVRLQRSVALAGAIVGLAVLGVGVWLAVLIGPSGTATFSATASGPVVLTPQVLNRVSVPAVVTVTGSEDVWVGLAAPVDVTNVLGTARHTDAVADSFPAGTLTLQTTGAGPLADPSSLPVWRSTVATGHTATLTVEQANAPESVLVVPTADSPVTVSVAMSHRGWFYQALSVGLVGLVIAVFGGARMLLSGRSGGRDDRSGSHRRHREVTA